MPETEKSHREEAKGFLHGAWDDDNDNHERTNNLLTGIGHAILALNEPVEAPKQRRRTGPLRFFGDSAQELEAAALDGAERIFGTDVNLRVVQDYPVYLVRPGSMEEEKAGGKEYFTTIVVEVIE